LSYGTEPLILDQPEDDLDDALVYDLIVRQIQLKAVYFRGANKIDEPHADGIADELTALANSAGGVLVLGVDDRTRQVEGIPRDRLDVVEQWLGNICRQRIDPPLYYRTQHLELPDAAGAPQPVVKIDVPRSLWVHKSANGYFHRLGSSRRELAPDHLARLFQQRSQVRIIRFDDQTVPVRRPPGAALPRHHPQFHDPGKHDRAVAAQKRGHRQPHGAVLPD
jgi:hypothetical protein